MKFQIRTRESGLERGSMPRDFIWDKTGKQLGWIEYGKVFDASTKECVGFVRDRRVYSLKDELVCHLAGLDKSGDTPEAFMKLLKKK